MVSLAPFDREASIQHMVKQTVNVGPPIFFH